MWSSSLLFFLKEWSEEKHQNPGNLKKYMLEQIDSIKQEITPFYFNHESFDSPHGPEMWFDDITLEYKNILVGYDTKEMKAIMTGRSSFEIETESWCDLCHASVTSFIAMDKVVPQKYYNIENAIGQNTTLCLKLAKCHHAQMKVSMIISKIDRKHLKTILMT